MRIRPVTTGGFALQKTQKYQRQRHKSGNIQAVGKPQFELRDRLEDIQEIYESTKVNPKRENQSNFFSAHLGQTTTGQTGSHLSSSAQQKGTSVNKMSDVLSQGLKKLFDRTLSAERNEIPITVPHSSIVLP